MKGKGRATPALTLGALIQMLVKLLPQFTPVGFALKDNRLK
jgi:hypothetical protein